MNPIHRNLLLNALCLILLVARVFAAGLPGDALQANSIWKGEDTYSLTIYERNGEMFRGLLTFPTGKETARVEVTANIKGDKISWLAKDQRPLNGFPGGDNIGTIRGNRIDFSWHRRDISLSGKYTLFRVPDKIQPPPLPPAVVSTPAVAPTPAVTLPNIQTDLDQPRIEVLKDQGPNAVEWALAPLDQMVPGDIRQNLTFLREDILTETQDKPKLSAARDAGVKLCDAIIGVLDERKLTLAKAGFRAVEANARTGVTSQALEARRNYKMSWPQFAREESQRAELKSQAIGNAQVMAERPKFEWAQRTAALQKPLDDLYRKYCEALRELPTRK